jgi:hypothetical protein
MEASRHSAFGFSNSLSRVRQFGKDDLRNYQQEIMETNCGSQSQRETTSKQLEINHLNIHKGGVAGQGGHHAESVSVVPGKRQKK